MNEIHVKSSRGRNAVLEQVKRKGPVTAETLATKLGVTGMAIRQNLEHLEQAGLVEHQISPGRRGRPSKLWRATRKAEGHFANSHAALAVDLISQVRKVFGNEGLDRLIALRTAEQERTYLPQIARGKSLRSRLERLARVRSQEGYMAEVSRESPDSWLLLEHHCPICSAARTCSGICQEELYLFRRVLGKGARVERVSHILAGAERCAYRVTPA